MTKRWLIIATNNDYFKNGTPNFYKSKNAIFKSGSRTHKTELEILKRYKASLKAIDKQLSDLFLKATKNGKIDSGLLTYAEINKANELNVNLSSIKSRLKSMHNYNNDTTVKSLERLSRDSYAYAKNLASKSLKIVNPSKIDYPNIASKNVVNGLQKSGQTLATQTAKAKSYYPDKTILKLRQAFLKEGGASLSEILSITRNALNSDAGNMTTLLRSNATRVANETNTLVYNTINKTPNLMSKTKAGNIETSEVMRKVWNHTSGQDNPRESHIKADGQIAIDGFFNVDGQMVEAPGYFGEPKNDYNCLCYITYAVEK